MTGLNQRQQVFWSLFDFNDGRGLEVGPLNRPIVERDQASVMYLDVMDREGLVKHYDDHPDVDVDEIPEVDFALIRDGLTRTLAEATRPGAPFDWVVASHVIEHVPDVIGWLTDLAEVVADGGALVLAVPDKRFCFDALRPETTVGEMLAAHLRGDQTPSVRAVYDHFSNACAVDIPAVWRGEAPSFDDRIHGLDYATQKVEEALLGTYVDCHVWLFSPESLIAQLHELRTIGRSSWYLERIDETPHNTLEFLAVLRRLPRGRNGTLPVGGEVTPTAVRPGWLDVEATENRLRSVSRDLDRSEAKVERQRERIERLRGRAQQRSTSRTEAKEAAGLEKLRSQVSRVLVRLRRSR